jgi:hypothetical protein
MKWFIGAVVAIAVVMVGIYFFANMDAIHLASNSAVPPVTTPAPEPSTPPPSTMSVRHCLPAHVTEVTFIFAARRTLAPAARF